MTGDLLSETGINHYIFEKSLLTEAEGWPPTYKYSSASTSRYAWDVPAPMKQNTTFPIGE